MPQPAIVTSVETQLPLEQSSIEVLVHMIQLDPGKTLE